jgi:hypothetical protein
VGPDRNKHLRNFAILILIALAVWQLPGGGTATITINDILGLMFAGGLVFFGYRIYMEHRTSVFMLEEKVRALLHGSLGLIALALVATRRLWDEGGFGVLVWLGLIGAGVYGCVTVYRLRASISERASYRRAVGAWWRAGLCNGPVLGVGGRRVLGIGSSPD